MVTRFVGDENGATAIEYGLLATLIAVAAVASVAVLGNSVANLMGTVTGSATEAIAAQSAEID